MVSVSVHQANGATSGQGPITHGRLTAQDAGQAALLFVENFPAAAQHWCRSSAHARTFYQDLIELHCLSPASVCFAARLGDRLAGYLILTLPGRPLWPALFRRGFFLRAFVRSLRGQYGLSWKAFGHALRSLVSLQRRASVHAPPHAPHVYILAVDPTLTGRGIGRGLLAQALAQASAWYPIIWLYVDADNAGARRFYERTGFRVVSADDARLLMACDLTAMPGTTGGQ